LPGALHEPLALDTWRSVACFFSKTLNLVH
jgi:hypothetical protein